MSITIVGADIEERIQRQLERGEYADASDVVAHALELLEDQEKLRVLREMIAEADAEEERGEVVRMTPDFWPNLWREADEADERGDPILDSVRP